MYHNPYFNQMNPNYMNNQYYRGANNYNQPYMRNGPLPFSTPSMRSPNSLLKGVLGVGATGKGLTLSKMLDGTQNIIATVNQAIPIYQQVKPLVSNSKVLTGALKKVFVRKESPSTQTRSTSAPHVETEIIKEKEKPLKERTTFKEQKEPSKPFF